MPLLARIAPVLLFILPACSVTPNAGISPDAPSVTERIAMALEEGDRAKNSKAMAKAAQTLITLGARPAEETAPDLGQIWAKQAHGGTDTFVYRGRILGPAYRNGSIIAGSAAATQQLFLAGNVAHVSVSPSAGARLNLAVTDSKGKAICQIVVGSPVGSCKWIPAFSERFEVTIGNPGPKSARYYLVVN